MLSTIRKGEIMRTPHYLMQFFEYKHLPGELAQVSKNFWNLADVVDQTLPNNPEKTVALRKLLESKGLRGARKAVSAGHAERIDLAGRAIGKPRGSCPRDSRFDSWSSLLRK